MRWKSHSIDPDSRYKCGIDKDPTSSQRKHPRPISASGSGSAYYDADHDFREEDCHLRLESEFCYDFVCCKTGIKDLYELLEHFEEYHYVPNDNLPPILPGLYTSFESLPPCSRALTEDLARAPLQEPESILACLVSSSPAFSGTVYTKMAAPSIPANNIANNTAAATVTPNPSLCPAEFIPPSYILSSSARTFLPAIQRPYSIAPFTATGFQRCLSDNVVGQPQLRPDLNSYSMMPGFTSSISDIQPCSPRSLSPPCFDTGLSACTYPDVEFDRMPLFDGIMGENGINCFLNSPNEFTSLMSCNNINNNDIGISDAETVAEEDEDISFGLALAEQSSSIGDSNDDDDQSNDGDSSSSCGGQSDVDMVDLCPEADNEQEEDEDDDGSDYDGFHIPGFGVVRPRSLAGSEGLVRNYC